MTTSLSTRVKRITLHQWRYYYNKLLLVDVPLNADFLKGLFSFAEDGSNNYLGNDDRGSGRCSRHFSGNCSGSRLGKASVVELEPMVSDDAIATETASSASTPMASHGLTPHELIRNELTKYEITRQRLESTLNQGAVPNIYSDMILNKGPNHGHATVVALPVSQDSHSMNSLMDIDSSIVGSVRSLIGLFEEQVVPVESEDVKVPVSLTRVSSLLATFL